MNFSVTPPRIGITMGDPAGIGPELVARLLRDEEIVRQSSVTVFGHRRILEGAWELVAGPEASPIPGEIMVLEPPDPVDVPPPVGKPSELSGRLALAYLDLAIAAARAGRIDGLVTAPLSKEAVALHRPGFTGHTEYLARAFGRTDRVGMLLQVDDLRALHVTTHCSLRQAIESLTVPLLLSRIRQGWQLIGELGIPVPRLAVMGLNPHAGEGGLFGDEEKMVLEPAVRRAREEGIDAVGPVVPDTAFVRARRGEFGLVVALYHDQGHIPLKLLGWERGVNVTVGLPFVRTSPDHGTAWEIAGRGVADLTSIKEAWRVAVRLVGSRH